MVVGADAGGPVEPAVGGGTDKLAVAGGKLASNGFVEGWLSFS